MGAARVHAGENEAGVASISWILSDRFVLCSHDGHERIKYNTKLQGKVRFLGRKTEKSN